jgi:poly-gamma-glutamate biosynthesis protein PgsC/CapC
LDVVLTLVAALVTYAVSHLLANVVIIYGKRRTVMMILIGYLVRMFIDWISLSAAGSMPTMLEAEISVIGYIIPGLIAIWIDRQGLVETLSTLVTAAVVVRLLMILIFGSELQL